MLLGYGKHGLGAVETDNADACLGHRNEAAARAATPFHRRRPGPLGFLQVEKHVSRLPKLEAVVEDGARPFVLLYLLPSPDFMSGGYRLWDTGYRGRPLCMGFTSRSRRAILSTSSIRSRVADIKFLKRATNSSGVMESSIQ